MRLPAMAPSSLKEGGSRVRPASHSLSLPCIVSHLSKRRGCFFLFVFNTFIDFRLKNGR